MKTKHGYTFGYLGECDVQYPLRKQKSAKTFQFCPEKNGIKAKSFSYVNERIYNTEKLN